VRVALTVREAEQRAAAVEPESKPTASERRPTTRDRVSAGLRETGRRPGERERQADRPGAAVVDLTARRTAVPTRATERAGATSARTGKRALAPVIPISRAPSASPALETTRQAAPAKAPADERGTTGLGRGPPAGGPPSATPTRTATSSPAAPVRAAVPVSSAPARKDASASPRAPPATRATKDTEAGPAAPGPEPVADPALAGLQERADAAVTRTTAHTRGKPAAANAQDVSAPDPDADVGRQAATVRIEDMGEQEPGLFDASKFKADVRAAVLKLAPPDNLDEAEKFKESGDAGAAAGVAGEIVASGKASSQSAIAVSTDTEPDRRNLEAKTPGMLRNDPAGPPVTTVGAASVLPAPRPDADVDLSSGPVSVDAAMVARGMTVAQLTEANEPSFTAALDARREVAEHAAADPVAFRAEESVILPGAAAAITADETAALAGMRGSRLGGLRDARKVKKGTTETDEKRRNDVNKSILGIHSETKDLVDGLLRGLDASVSKLFTDGEAEARYMFEHYVDFKMMEYKNDRYGGWGGGALWLKDRFFDLPGEVNDFYEQGREFYLMKLDRTIDTIAAVVGSTLWLAVTMIQIGRARVRHLLTTLPADLVQLGVETAATLDQRFDLLTGDVEAAKDRLVDSVARQYVDATGKLDARIVQLQEENKGLVTRAVEFVEDVANTIADLGRLLARVIVKAVSVIGDILAHPIRFFEHLIDGVGAGIDLFASRIGRHIEEALLDLLFGHLDKAGITLPETLDYAGIFDLVCQILELRWIDIRARLVDKVGLATVLRMEQVVETFQLLRHGGLGALWELAMQRLSELPDRIIGALRKYIVEQVIVAGIGYIAALLTPVSGFIKACQGIYRIVSFIVEKAKQIADFVDSILDSLAAIAAGDVTKVAEKIDAALAGGLKLALGFLAKLAHLDAIPDKVQSVVLAIRTPVRRTVDAIIDGAVGVFRSGEGSRDDRVAVSDMPRGPPSGTSATDAAASRGRQAGALPPVPGQAPGQKATKGVPAPQPEDPHSITVTKKTVMDDTNHVLTFKVVAGQPEVVMSSERAEFLRSMTSAAIHDEDHGDHRETLIANLRLIEKELGDLYFEWRANHSKADSEKRYAVDKRLGQIAEYLRDIGRRFKIDDLHHLGHMSRHVEGNQLVPPYDTDIRERMYPSGYLAATDEWRAAELYRLRDTKDPRRRFMDMSESPPKSYPNNQASIDHKPRVVEHWNRIGNNTVHEARRNWYNDVSEANLQIISLKNNSADGARAKAMGHSYQPKVGRDFRGPWDEK